MLSLGLHSLKYLRSDPREKNVDFWQRWNKLLEIYLLPKQV